MDEFTAITFAPVQGFIEKSRKLRDLFGGSLILSFLSYRIVQEIKDREGVEVISPGLGLPELQKGMPNRILIKGKIKREEVKKILLREWQTVLTTCREWIEDNLDIPKEEYTWSQKEDEKGKQKGEWERWGSYTWEVFWGYGETIKGAMEDLEARKLKRDWVAINWTGESSSLTGTDAIAWHHLGKFNSTPGERLSEAEEREMKRFYLQLAWVLDDPGKRKRESREKKPLAIPNDAELEAYFKRTDENGDASGGRFIAPNERLSIPELVKRLVTWEPIAEEIGMEKLKLKKDDPEFKDITRKAGYWTGWFMGDGDKVGDKLKQIAKRSNRTQEQQAKDLTNFTTEMRKWGQKFEQKKDLFEEGKGRVIYAGGDDFLGVLYSEEGREKVQPIEALKWLLQLSKQWEPLQEKTQQYLSSDEQFTFSVGFVWAGHSVPQRDILQHCREAEKRSKNLGRDRVTIRVVFNSGQYVQWTCPWEYLGILTKYRDRDGKTWGDNPNWAHIYNDWATLKARHAIRLRKTDDTSIDEKVAITLFNLYFDNAGEKLKQESKKLKQESKWVAIAGDNTQEAIVNWLNDLVQVGWQLC